MIEDAITEVKDLLRPFEAGHLGWVRMPMDKARTRYALAITVPLSSAACTPNVLAELIAGIADKLRVAFEQEPLTGLQITFGREYSGEMKRCYRVIIPAEHLKEASSLQTLPETRYQNSPGIQGFWFSNLPSE